jgi:GTP-binding protein YchF|tara:strand:+ start:1200 stop:2300 length:1101 start_codon:yes stop_codon:yes gene_type:complete
LAIGIFGLPQSGKTTIFNAVTKGHAETASFKSSGARPNVGVAKVPDFRLEDLASISNPKKIIYAEVEYIDIPTSPDGLGKTKGIGGEYLNVLQRCEALLLVSRAFENPSVPNFEDSIDPYRDASTLQLELMFSDLAILERRQERISNQLKSAKQADKDLLNKEQLLITNIKEGLENEIPVRDQELPEEAAPLLENFQLLSSKPLIIVFNIDENDIHQTHEIENSMINTFASSTIGVAALCGDLEMQLGQMNPEDEQDFRDTLDAGEPGLDRMVKISYELLGLISFLTTGEDETRAWTIRNGMTAVEAAGKIHSDIQRGFIRAEVIAYTDLSRVRSIAEARKQAVLRSEGKTYVMQDGDVVNFLNNV